MRARGPHNGCASNGARRGVDEPPGTRDSRRFVLQRSYYAWYQVFWYVPSGLVYGLFGGIYL